MTPLRQRIVAVLVALLPSGAALATDACTPLDRLYPRQGELVRLKLAAGARLWLDAQALPVAADGWTTFAAARDRVLPLALRVLAADGSECERRVPVSTRSWPIERVDSVPPDTVDPPPAIAARIAREQAAVAASRSARSLLEDFTAAFSWPVQGRVSGRFGSQRIYNGGRGSPHSGMDIAAPAGTPVRAPAGGIVIFADPALYLTGGTVLIDHGFGVNSSFLHLSRIDVQVGDRVEPGQVLGAVGATGRATGPHLHWGVSWGDVRVEPADLLPAPE